MTAAFVVAAVVAVVAIGWAVVTARKSAAALAAQRSHAALLEAELNTARQARAEAEDRLQQHEDEWAQRAAEPRADASAQGATDAGDRLAAGDTLWDLERLRLEREWREVTGVPTPLPEPWDGSVRAAIAVELELIREVIGIPTRLEPGPDGAPGAEEDGPLGAGAGTRTGGEPGVGPPASADPIANLGAARLTAEVLRTLARVGEEVVVSVEPDGSVHMNVATEGPTAEPDLRQLTSDAATLGGDLVVNAVPGGIEARLRPPGSTA